MSWRLLAPGGGDGAVASAELRDARGEPAGVLSAWERDDERAPGGAARVDAGAVGPDGVEMWASLVLAAEGVSLPFDDMAVSGALRAVLAAEPPDVVSTLLVDEVRFAGAISGWVGEPRDDPFARVFPARLARIGPGLLRPRPAPPGPGIARYGGGQPWPFDRFPE